MIDRTMTLFLIVVFAISASAFRGHDDWQQFVSPDKAFTVLMPNEPKHSTETKDVSAGKIVTEIWTAIFERGVYVVGDTTYPVDVDPKKELDLDRDNFLKAVSATLTSESDISLGGYAGREFSGRSDTYEFRSRVVLISNRHVYQVAAGTPLASGNSSLATKFLTSFEILKAQGKQ